MEGLNFFIHLTIFFLFYIYWNFFFFVRNNLVVNLDFQIWLFDLPMCSTKSPFGYSWKLKIEKHCSKIIFKCVNSILGPIFNEKIDKKWYLWVCEQCTNALFTIENVSIYGWKQKKKGWNAFCAQTWTQNAQTKHSLRFFEG